MKTSSIIGSLALTLAVLPASCASPNSGNGGGSAGSAGSVPSSGGSNNQAGSQSTSAGDSFGGTAPSSAGTSSKAGAPSSGGNPSVGGSGSAGTGTGVSGSPTNGGGPPSGAGCDVPGLEWKTGAKTNFESYPEPGSEECIEYNGCAYAGQFSFCDGTKPETWVSEHNLVAVFPSDGLENHDLCLKSGDKTIVVTVVDTCGDSDCDGCCTQNLGSADGLIDLEKYTNERWGVEDGEIQFADLGANDSACD